jgi:formate-dependent nitrite reductase cytochrome c552 subunit
MSEKIWIGGIYLKEEGGYEIILKSLQHYKKRLRSIEDSPELKEAAAMFGPLLIQQAMKAHPKVIETIKKIQNNIGDIKTVINLEDGISLFEKALTCYESDIHKAQQTEHEYFKKLIENLEESKKDVDTIKVALEKIKQYSE